MGAAKAVPINIGGMIMLSVNSPRPNEVKKTFDQQCIEGITFEVVRTQGLSVILKHNSSDTVAKAVCKKVLKEIPALKRMVCSCQIVDENGNLI